MAKSQFNWSNPRVRNLGLVVFSLLVAYLAASWAIDSGSIWLYLITLGFCYLAVVYVGRFVGSLRNKKKS